jgi:hypothetical protein
MAYIGARWLGRADRKDRKEDRQAHCGANF